MKHIPIMLALALSVSLTSFDGDTRTSSNDINVSESKSTTMNIIDSDDLRELSTMKSMESEERL